MYKAYFKYCGILSERWTLDINIISSVGLKLSTWKQSLRIRHRFAKCWNLQKERWNLRCKPSVTRCPDGTNHYTVNFWSYYVSVGWFTTLTKIRKAYKNKDESSIIAVWIMKTIKIKFLIFFCNIAHIL